MLQNCVCRTGLSLTESPYKGRGKRENSPKIENFIYNYMITWLLSSGAGTLRVNKALSENWGKYDTVLFKQMVIMKELPFGNETGGGGGGKPLITNNSCIPPKPLSPQSVPAPLLLSTVVPLSITNVNTKNNNYKYEKWNFILLSQGLSHRSNDHFHWKCLK